jgi:hypothetical protein
MLLCLKQLFLPRRELVRSLYRNSLAGHEDAHASELTYEEARQALYAPAAGIPALADVDIDQLERAGVFMARVLAAWGLVCTVLIPLATALAFCAMAYTRTGGTPGWAGRLLAPGALGFGLGFALGLLVLARLTWVIGEPFRRLTSWLYGVPIVDAAEPVDGVLDRESPPSSEPDESGGRQA